MFGQTSAFTIRNLKSAGQMSDDGRKFAGLDFMMSFKSKLSESDNVYWNKF